MYRSQSGLWLEPLCIVSSFYVALYFRCSSWQRLWSVGLQQKVRSSPSIWIVSPSKRRKCVVSCSECRTLFGVRTSRREIFSRKQAGACCRNLLLSLISLSWALCMRHGVLLHLRLLVRSSRICAPVGIGWCCGIALPRTLVSAGIMVAPIGVKQRQGQGWGYRTWLRRGALVRLLLVLLGQARSVLLPARGRGKSLLVRWSCHGGLKCQVPLLVPHGGL